MCLLQVYSVRVRVNTDHVLGLLLEKEQFNIARKYAELVNSTKSQISIKEVQDYLCIASKIQCSKNAHIRVHIAPVRSQL